MTTVITKGATPIKVLTGKEAHNVLRLAEDAYLPGHFDNVVAQVEQIIGVPLRWKAIGGGGRVAHSALGSAAEATHLLSEPVINFFDAALEMYHALAVKAGDTYEPQSMAEAATRWLGVPEGGLPAWDTTAGDAKRVSDELARKSQILIRHGSKKETPTIVFLDNWIGQHPSRHEDTILSLQLGLKADTPFLAGQYGHGAAFTFAFTRGGQILISRRHPDLLDHGQDDLVGLSLVKLKMPSETGGSNPTYWYAVDPETEKPVAFSPQSLSNPSWHGLRRLCIDYELLKSSERDIYNALDHNINNPAMPYAIRDERTDKGEARQFHFMRGTAARLQRAFEGRRTKPGKKEIVVPYRRTRQIDLGAFVGDGTAYGVVDVTTTYVRQEGTGKGNELFAPPKEAEIWTLNGQRHHARSRLHFGQAAVGLEAIRDNLLVDVKLDKLSADAKALILTTDRQGAADRQLTAKLEEAIDQQLHDDPDLRKLHDDAMAEALSKAADSDFEELERELVQFQHFISRTKRVRVKKEVPGGKRKKPTITPLPPITPLHTHPTFLRFRKNFRDVLKVMPGHTASVQIEADAVDGYFNVNRQPSFQFNPPTGTTLAVYAKEELIDGRMRVWIKAAPTAALGKTMLSGTYLPPNAKAPLTTAIDVEVVPAKTKTPGPGKQGRKIEYVWEDQQVEAPPKSLPVFEDISPTWAEHGLHDWTIDTIAQYKNGVVYVNGSNPAVQQMLDDCPKDKSKEYLALYMAPVVMTVVAIHKQEINPPKDDNDKDVPLNDAYREAALRSASLGSIFTIRKLKKLGLGGE